MLRDSGATIGTELWSMVIVRLQPSDLPNAYLGNSGAYIHSPRSRNELLATFRNVSFFGSDAIRRRTHVTVLRG